MYDPSPYMTPKGGPYKGGMVIGRSANYLDLCFGLAGLAHYSASGHRRTLAYFKVRDLKGLRLEATISHNVTPSPNSGCLSIRVQGGGADLLYLAK